MDQRKKKMFFDWRLKPEIPSRKPVIGTTKEIESYTAALYY